MALSMSILYYAQAQTTDIDKYFKLGNNPSGTLDDFNYNNGEQLSYDVSGYPPITIIIHHWQDISTVNKTLIVVRLSGMGYVEGEEQTVPVSSSSLFR